MMGVYFHKGVLYLMGTWLSYPGEPPEDFPEYFTVDDLIAENIPPDHEADEHLKRWKEKFNELYGSYDS